MATVLDAAEDLPHRLGLTALRAGQPQNAAQFFLKAIEKNRTFTEAWCGLAEALTATDELQGALLALNSALHTDPSHVRALALRRHILTRLEAGAETLRSTQSVQNPGELGAQAIFNLVETHGPLGQTQASGIPSGSRRRFFTEQFAWAVPTQEAIATVLRFADGQSLLEIGSGRGLWATLIQQGGGTVLATDDYSTHSNAGRDNDSQARHQIHQAFTFVERMNHAEALKKYGFCPVLMMCWPPFGLGMSEETLTGFRGDKFIYIGEQLAAAEPVTGSESFHQRLHREWRLSAKVDIPRWPGVYDALYLYRRKTL